MDNLIVFDNICKSYNNNMILKNLNLSIDEGEFVTIIGSSGCGKTTLLKLINGLITPNCGSVYINNKDISKINQIELRRSIGYVIQEIGLFPNMNVEKNISYVLNLNKSKNRNKSKIKNKAHSMSRMVGLDEGILDMYPSELSGGQRQRVGIARALISNPSILLMDEPFGAVDDITRKILQRSIKEIHLNTNTTIVFVTHDISEALTLATKVLVMDNGIIHQFAPPKDIINNPKTSFVKKLVSNYKNSLF